MHRGAVVARLRPVRSLARELADVVAGRERLLAGTAQDQAAQRVVGRERVERTAESVHIGV